MRVKGISRKLRWLLSLLLLVAFGAAITAWFMLPVLVKWGARYGLERGGGREIKVGDASVTWNSVTLSDLHFIYPAVGARAAVASLEVYWDLRRLRHGRVEEVKVSGAVLSIDPALRAGPAPDTPSPRAPFTVTSSLPVDRLTITESTLSFSGGSLAVKSLRGDLDRAAGKGVISGGGKLTLQKAHVGESEMNWEISATVRDGQAVLFPPTQVELAPYAETLTVAEPLTITWTPLTVRSGEITAQGLRVPLSDGEVFGDAATVRFTDPAKVPDGAIGHPPSVRAAVTLHEVGMRSEAFTIHPRDLGGDIRFSPSLLEVSLATDEDPSKKLQGSVRYDLRNGDGEWQVALGPHPFADLGTAQLPESVQLVSGRITGDANGAWGASSYVRVNGEIDDGAATVHGASMRGIHVRAAIDTRGGLHTTAPAVVRIRTVDLPVPIEDISAAVRWSNGSVAIDRAKARVLEGIVQVPSARIPRAGGWTVPVEVQDLDLSKLLTLYPQERVSGTGALSGKVTVEYDGSAFAIDDGLLQSDRGTIRYDAAGLSAMKAEGLGLALGALENFAYDLLRARIEMEPSGKLNVGIELQGRNPQWQSGRPVHFNLSIEENLYKLLESIKLARGDFSAQDLGEVRKPQ